MRLIDADALKQCYTGTNGKDDKAQYASIRAMIDNQPTAYDVDKVAKNIEKLRQPYTTFPKGYGNLNAYDFYIENAKAIVKGGGLDE